MTTTETVTNKQIKTLRAEADAAGDLRQAMICVLAIGGPEALDGGDPGNEADMLLSEGRDQEWARTECARVIASAESAA